MRAVLRLCLPLTYSSCARDLSYSLHQSTRSDQQAPCFTLDESEAVPGPRDCGLLSPGTRSHLELSNITVLATHDCITSTVVGFRLSPLDMQVGEQDAPMTPAQR